MKKYKELVYIEDDRYVDIVLKEDKIPIINKLKDIKMSKVIMGKCDEVWIEKESELNEQALKWRKVIKWI